MSQLIRLYNYLVHFVLARNTKGYGVHSPFLFQFTRFVLMEQNPFYVFKQIEQERSRLLNDKSTLVKQDFGTGNSGNFKVSDIAKRSLSGRRKGELMYRIINYLDLDNQLELGTSFGISTAYLASSSAPKRKCISLEGCENTARIAQNVLSNLGLKKVELIIGDIDKTILIALNKLSVVDFVLLDANHSYNATCAYFEKIKPFLSDKAVVVVDDIYWSDGMKRAWDYIKSDTTVTATIDLYHFGIVFVNKDLHKENYKMRFGI